MNKTEFVNQLRAIAEVLTPLTQAVAPGAMVWNGTEYAKAEERKPNPYALAWWSSLTAIAELIEAQETPLSTKQLSYLDRFLFGGMGSLNDLSFDLKSSGVSADLVNKRLHERRPTLFASFHEYFESSDGEALR